jgi:hypothetical protein
MKGTERKRATGFRWEDSKPWQTVEPWNFQTRRDYHSYLIENTQKGTVEVKNRGKGDTSTVFLLRHFNGLGRPWNRGSHPYNRKYHFHFHGLPSWVGKMKQSEYMKTVLEKLQDGNTIICEDCGSKDKIGHMIIDHQAGTVKAVCHSCFVAKYEAGIYGPEFRA